MKKILFFFLTTTFGVSMLSAQKPAIVTSNKPGWHKISEANVNFRTDKDEFKILGADKFKAIRLIVQDAPVRVEDLKVFYEGGKVEDLSVRSVFRTGSKSRIIYLKNPRRDLDKVEFVYKTIPNSKSEKARIELWGLK